MVVLPEPDSPTMASDPASGTPNDTSSTATSVAELLAQAGHLQHGASPRAPGRARPRARIGSVRHPRPPAAPRAARCARTHRDSPPPISVSAGHPGQAGVLRVRAARRERALVQPAPRTPTAAGRGSLAAGAPSARCPGALPASAAVYGCSGSSCSSAERADLDDLAGVHDRGAVADRGRQLQVVGDEEHGQAELAAQVVEDRHHLRLGGDVERGGRLVGQQQPRLGQQRRGDHHPLQHAARQLVRVLPEPALPVLDADLAEHVDGAGARLGRPGPTCSCAAPRS